MASSGDLWNRGETFSDLRAPREEGKELRCLANSAHIPQPGSSFHFLILSNAKQSLLYSFLLPHSHTNSMTLQTPARIGSVLLQFRISLPPSPHVQSPPHSQISHTIQN